MGGLDELKHPRTWTILFIKFPERSTTVGEPSKKHNVNCLHLNLIVAANAVKLSRGQQTVIEVLIVRKIHLNENNKKKTSLVKVCVNMFICYKWNYKYWLTLWLYPPCKRSQELDPVFLLLLWCMASHIAGLSLVEMPCTRHTRWVSHLTASLLSASDPWPWSHHKIYGYRCF